ncbi:hypothetical protein [Taibaiella helva]|uniref:hypothetical protein n=1 Tax=Taibaiella helva TaxID=2301235 RepID=UPI001300B690|nr:hypothetical protein [Taibaiella helva]
MKKKDEIAAELKALTTEFGAAVAGEPAFHTPEHYFRDFPGQMKAIIRAMNANTALSLPVSKDGPYSVPPGYFETLEQDILARIKLADTIVTGATISVPGATREIPFELPEGYFARFEQELHQKLFHSETPVQEELQELSPLLAGLQQEQPFAVPGGYFNSDAFVRQVQEQQQPKVVEHPSVRSIKWARWAAAAAVIAIFAMGGLHYLVPGGKQSSRVSFEQALAKIPEKNIKEWLSNNMDESDINNLGSSIANISIPGPSSTLSNLSEQQIRDYLDAEMW